MARLFGSQLAVEKPSGTQSDRPQNRGIPPQVPLQSLRLTLDIRGLPDALRYSFDGPSGGGRPVDC
jgi:hypothetical protein